MSLTQLIVLSNLILGTIITGSSHHWLTAWVGLELNTLSILAIMMQPKHPRTTEASIKYFLIQTIASTTMVFSGTINAMETGQWNISQLTNNHACTLFVLAAMTKIGAAPTHFWLPEVMQGATMKTALIIATWQKIAPITLLFLTHNLIPNKIMVIIGVLSALIGGWGGMNQTQLQKILAYSSIANSGWTMVIFSTFPHTAALNITVYMLMLIPAFLVMDKMSLKTLRDTTTTWTTSSTASSMLTLLLLSLSGLPPLTGFLPKLLILNKLVTQNMAPVASTMAVLSLLSLFFYLRTTYTTTMTTPPTTTQTTMKWRLLSQHQKLTPPLILFSLISTPMLPTLAAMT